MEQGFWKKTWCAVSSPTKKTKITGKWFAVLYKGKQKTTFFTAKINKWFLEDDIAK